MGGQTFGDSCEQSVFGGSAPDHTYSIRVESYGVREFCSNAVVQLFQGDRTTPLTASQRVPTTTNENVDGCASGQRSFSFVVTPGLYTVVVNRKFVDPSKCVDM